MGVGGGERVVVARVATVLLTLHCAAWLPGLPSPNRPAPCGPPTQELDEAARRRMPKQLYIPLPDAEARRGMVLRQLGPGAGIKSALSEGDVQKVVRHTEGYSG